MATYRYDIAFDFFSEKIHEAADDLRAGQDVTEVFADDVARPVKAKILDPQGPGGGNPYVEFEFQDADHAWEWASENMDMCPEDFELGEVT